MDQDATWYGAMPQPRRLCVKWGPSPPPKFSAYVYYSYCDFLHMSVLFLLKPQNPNSVSYAFDFLTQYAYIHLTLLSCIDNNILRQTLELDKKFKYIFSV